MSVTVSLLTHIQMPPVTERLATLSTDGQLIIYPQGMGVGPMLIMSMEDWERLCHEVRLAAMQSEARGAKRSLPPVDNG